MKEDHRRSWSAHPSLCRLLLQAPGRKSRRGGARATGGMDAAAGVAGGTLSAGRALSSGASGEVRRRKEGWGNMGRDCMSVRFFRYMSISDLIKGDHEKQVNIQ